MKRNLSLMEHVFECALQEEKERLEVRLQWCDTVGRLPAEEENHAEIGGRYAVSPTCQEETVRDRLADVTAALRRLDEGRYGNCEGCGSQIELSSLLEAPWTRYCAGCLDVMTAGSAHTATSPAAPARS
ncbi:MAG TPA: TraR/DksA C4-type zinc finger protein [Chloroflexota bacterium]|nr:TraR/DksA C4-type zinc finger protein [Chloroflexota bacterium]